MLPGVFLRILAAALGAGTDEITYDYENTGFKTHFYDDALLYRAEESFLPLQKLYKRTTPLRFSPPNSIHARYVTREIAELMRECNFETLRISLEFSDVDSQKHWK